MVLRPEPVVECVEWLEREHGRFRKFALCPTGRPFQQDLAKELAAELEGDGRLLFLCGRYEGFDERIREELAFEDLSLGDFVLSGGELPALVVAEAVTRLLPGALGDERSAAADSFEAGAGGTLLDHPHYTRPRVFRGRDVPQVLLSGDHAAIERWRLARALERTRALRPDLLPPTEHKSTDTSRP
jgi:tRNA (guanine37-N1)-methyltransferase